MPQLSTLHEGFWAPKKKFLVKQAAASFKTRFKEWHNKKIEDFLTNSNTSSFMNFVDISVRKVQLQGESVHSVIVSGFSNDINCVLDYLIGYEKAETTLQDEQKVSTSSIRGEFKIYKSSKIVHTDNSSGSVESDYSGYSLEAKDWNVPMVPPQFFVPIPTPQPKLQRVTGTLIVGGTVLNLSNCTNWPIKHLLITSSSEGGLNISPEEEANIQIRGADFENVIFELTVFEGDLKTKITSACDGLLWIPLTTRKSIVYWIFRNLIEEKQ